MAEQDDRETGQYLLAAFWEAALGFWRRGAGPTAWVLTILLVVLAFVNLAVQYRLNVWNRAMFDALDHRDARRRRRGSRSSSCRSRWRTCASPRPACTVA